MVYKQIRGILARRKNQQRRFRRTDISCPDLESLEVRRMLTTLAVNSDLDGPVDLSDHVVTLRDAIHAANNDVAVSPGGPVGSGADTIEFNASMANAVIRLTEGPLEIHDEVTIDGRGLGIAITGDAANNDLTVAGTSITDVGATRGSDPTLLDDNTAVIRIVGQNSVTTISGLTITGGRTTLFTGHGAGVSSDANLTITDSTISGNSTAGNLARGGGIYLEGTRSLSMSNSTVTGNSTSGGSAPGGAIWTGTFDIVSSTITGNSTAGGNARGGAIYSISSSTLTNSIVTGNVAVNSGNNEMRIVSGSLTRQGGVIEGGNRRENSAVVQTGLTVFDIFATTTEVIDGQGNATGVFTGMLTDNGGQTLTIALLSGGAAVDTGDSSLSTDISSDQRGALFTRVFGAETDLGAFEVQSLDLVVDTSQDIDDGDYSTGNLSLREALKLTNANSGVDTISIDSSLAGETILLAGTPLRVTDDVAVTGPGASRLTIDAGGSSRVLLIESGNVAVSGLTLANGRAGRGGGIRNNSSATTQLTDVHITGSVASTSTTDAGGGVWNAGNLTILGSTISANSTTSGLGGGIFNSGTLVISSSTISGNNAFSDGGGIANRGTATVSHCTITENEGFLQGGGIFGSAGTVSVTHSLIVGNTAAFGSEITGRVTLDSFNLIGDSSVTTGQAVVVATVGASDITATSNGSIPTALNAIVHSLNDNGGPTPTHALPSGSPAIDSGDTGLAASPEFDQRGLHFSRDVGTAPDIGAYEVQTLSLVVDTAVDESDGDFSSGDLSLREAIELTNGNPGADTILFDVSLTGSLIRLTEGELTIDDQVAIDGTGLDITVSGDAAGNDVLVSGTHITDVAATLASDSTLLDDNSRVFNIAGDYSDTTIHGLTVTGGRTTTFSADGGGISSEAPLTIINSTVSGNSTSGVSADGGGIFAADSLTLTNSTVSGNSTAGIGAEGGGINTRSELEIIGSTISGNSTVGHDSQGGGVYARRDVILTSSTISGNSTAGLYSSGGGLAGYGEITISNSTVSGNSTSGRRAYGGGIFGAESLTLTNSTISGNSTTGWNASGGGIYIRDWFTIHSSTITGNSTAGADAYGGGIHQSEYTAILANSIIAGNVSRNTADDDLSRDAGFPLILRGGNILGDKRRNYSSVEQTGLTAADIFAATTEVFDGNGNATGVLTGVLADNGGATFTIALLQGGAAHNTGIRSTLPKDVDDLDADGNEFETIPVDQRGLPFSRDVGTAPDIGAYEIQTLSLVVDTAVDESDGDFTSGDLSLREAIELANGNPGADTILFNVSLTGSLIRLTEGELTIDDQVTIDGTGLDITISGDAAGNDIPVSGTHITDVAATLASDSTLLDDNSRVFRITTSNADTTIHGLTITGGRTTRSSADGGGIRSEAPLTVISSTVSGNSTSGEGAEGGGIFAADLLTLTNSTISGNSTGGSGAEGGGIHTQSDLEIIGSTISGNSTAGNNSQGGGVYARRDVILTSSTISGNSTAGRYSSGGGLIGYGDITISNSTVSGNSTSGRRAEGGGILVGGSLTLTNSTVSGNSTTGRDASGGGIYIRDWFTIDSSTITGNSTAGVNAYGGGIHQFAYQAHFANSIIAGNVSRNTADDDLSRDAAFYLDLDGGNILGDTRRNYNSVKQTGLTAADIFAATTEVFDGNGNGTGVLTGVLADNGGATFTIALLQGGAAHNTGTRSSLPKDVDDLDADGDTSETIPIDQRGIQFDRFRSGTPDLGAFEVQGEPQVESVVVDNDAANGGTQNSQRSMVRKLTVTFDAAVTIDSAAFSLQRSINGSSESFIIADADVAASDVNGRTVVVLSFENSTTGIVGGSLADGHYTLTIDATKIRTVIGSDMMAENHIDEFFRFFGDVDGDGDVDARDFQQFRGTYRRTDADAAFNGLFDFNGDGVVDAMDYLEFRSRYRRSL